MTDDHSVYVMTVTKNWQLSKSNTEDIESRPAQTGLLASPETLDRSWCHLLCWAKTHILWLK